jgi:hypothetical protein
MLTLGMKAQVGIIAILVWKSISLSCRSAEVVKYRFVILDFK